MLKFEVIMTQLKKLLEMRTGEMLIALLHYCLKNKGRVLLSISTTIRVLEKSQVKRALIRMLLPNPWNKL